MERPCPLLSARRALPLLAVTPSGIGTNFDGSLFRLQSSKTCCWYYQLPAPVLQKKGLARTLYCKCHSVSSHLPPGAVLQPAPSSPAGQGRGTTWCGVSRRRAVLAYSSCSNRVGSGEPCRLQYYRFSYLLGSLKFLCSPECLSGCCYCREELA